MKRFTLAFAIVVAASAALVHADLASARVARIDIASQRYVDEGRTASTPKRIWSW